MRLRLSRQPLQINVFATPLLRASPRPRPRSSREDSAPPPWGASNWYRCDFYSPDLPSLLTAGLQKIMCPSSSSTDLTSLTQQLCQSQESCETIFSISSSWLVSCFSQVFLFKRLLFHCMNSDVIKNIIKTIFFICSLWTFW